MFVYDVNNWERICEGYMEALYYFAIFSVSLKVAQNKKFNKKLLVYTSRTVHNISCFINNKRHHFNKVLIFLIEFLIMR